MLKREVKGRVFYEVKLSFLIYLVVLFSSAASEVLHSDVGTRIIIKPDEFLPPDKHIASYPSTSLAQCMALVQSKHDSKGFCVTPDDRCLVLIFTYPPNYDDGSGEDDHLCYTMEEPSIDIAAALAACGGGPCCPTPFFDYSYGGCIYTPPDEKTFWAARTSCQALFPGADLYNAEKLPSSEFMDEYIEGKSIVGPWVGVYRDDSGEWVKVDGSELGDIFHGGFLFIYAKQPKNIEDEDGILTGCAIISEKNPPNSDAKLFDEWCYQVRRYICHIPQ